MYDDAEEDFDLYVAPKKAEFCTLKGGASRHLMVNGTDHRIAIKIKCSNNSLYRLAPVYVCLDPGRSKRLHVVRDSGGPARVDKLVFLYQPTRCKSAKEAFQSSDSGIGHEDGDVNEGAQQIKRTLIALVARDPPPPPQEGEVSSTAIEEEGALATNQNDNEIKEIDAI